jgi:hypothetical protein
MAVKRINEPPGPDDPLFNGVWFAFEHPRRQPDESTSESGEQPSGLPDFREALGLPPKGSSSSQPNSE